MNAIALADTLVILAVATPGSALAALGVPTALRRPLPEHASWWVTRTSMWICFLSLASALVVFVAAGVRAHALAAGTWFSSGGGAFRFDFLVDAMSLGFGTLAAGMCGVVAAFSHRYLHRDPGFNRYFILFSIFLLGMLFVALAGSIEVLFAGWELLGLSSALLVGFYHERRAPVTNALRVFAVYRISDAAMLAAAVLLHHVAGTGSLSLLFSPAAGGTGPALSATALTLIGVLLIAAVAGKCALLPFSGWLPRAMEGPTPSSAVYYGALSIHAGCYLLLRAGPVLEQSMLVRALAIAAGASTALYATLCARVQTDVKSALAYASLTQVGVIVVEIALGLETVAFIHLAGHASFRLLQFLSAPNVLHDIHELQNKMQSGAANHAHAPRQRPTVRPWERRLYLFALERGFLDALLDRWVIGPLQRGARALDRLDRRLAAEPPPAPREGERAI